MACPLTFQENQTPAAALTIPDLSELVIAASDTINVEDLFDIETVANSVDLAAALLAGDVIITYGTQNITSLDQLCIPAIVDNYDIIWNAGRRRGRGQGIDLARFGNLGNVDVPFMAPFACEIQNITARSESLTDWTLQILKSTNEGGTWTTEKTETIDSQTKTVDYTVSTTVSLAQGDLIRFRWVRVANNTNFPQVTATVKQTA